MNKTKNMQCRMPVDIYKQLLKEAARNKLKLAEYQRLFWRSIIECTGCGMMLDRCGPQLWQQAKTCCPDCSHSTLRTSVLAEFTQRFPQRLKPIKPCE